MPRIHTCCLCLHTLTKPDPYYFWRMNHCLIYKLAEVLKGVNKLQCTVDNVKLLAKAPGEVGLVKLKPDPWNLQTNSKTKKKKIN